MTTYTVAVAGGTGMVGKRLVAALEARGHQVRVLSRATGVDLVAGTGLAEALVGVEVVIDVTSTPSRSARECVRFFGAVAENLQRAGAEAGVGQIITLSIAGIDGLDGGGAYGHYAGKLAQEAATRAGTVPSTILRATQFHEFAAQFIAWTAIGPVLPCPLTPVQTVELRVVVEHLADLVGRTDTPLVNLAGPEKRLLSDLVRAEAHAQGRRLWVLPVWLPGPTPRRVREGALQAPPGAIIEGPGFQEWLTAR